MAADYLVKRFQELGIQAKGEDGYFQDFIFKTQFQSTRGSQFLPLREAMYRTGRNVIGYIDNQASKTIIIGAHFDHLGMGGQGSLYRGEEPAIHNGADDNASGVAVMLQLAERLKSVENVMTNYLFIGFSGEELGLLGSNYFGAKHPTIDLSTVDVMINMDMVGRLNTENTLAVHGVGTSPTFKQLLFANNDQGFTIAEHESGINSSDHTSFYLEDIPVLHFFTGQHEDYHKPSDDFDKLNYEVWKNYPTYIYNDCDGFGRRSKLAFRKTKTKVRNPRFKSRIRVVPDYLFTGEGMRIDGISEDKAAQKQGCNEATSSRKWAIAR